MKDLAVHAGQVQRDCGLDIVPADFCKETLKFGLMEVLTLPLLSFTSECSRFCQSAGSVCSQGLHYKG